MEKLKTLIFLIGFLAPYGALLLLGNEYVIAIRYIEYLQVAVVQLQNLVQTCQ